MARKLLFLSIAVAIALVVIVGCGMFNNPLRQSEAGVRDWMLKQTPLGTTSQEVRSIAEHHGWFNPNLQGSDGHTSGPYLRGELGRYWSVPFYTYVTVFWEFDSSNRLANIRIWKTTDGP
jgi:hypothetical protein